MKTIVPAATTRRRFRKALRAVLPPTLSAAAARRRGHPRPARSPCAGPACPPCSSSAGGRGRGLRPHLHQQLVPGRETELPAGLAGDDDLVLGAALHGAPHAMRLYGQWSYFPFSLMLSVLSSQEPPAQSGAARDRRVPRVAGVPTCLISLGRDLSVCYPPENRSRGLAGRAARPARSDGTGTRRPTDGL